MSTEVSQQLRAALTLLALSFAASVLGSDPNVGQPTNISAHANTGKGPSAVYSSDVGDPWNRIFNALFTRRVRARMSGEFPEAGPFVRGNERVSHMRVSTRLFEQAEEGDRSIEPLYPSFLGGDGPAEALRDPRFSQLKSALEDALKDTRPRMPLARALMQSDAWAAFDILFKISAPHPASSRAAKQIEARKVELLDLLARLIKKVSLTPEEVGALPDNYTVAARAGNVPDLYSGGDAWVEVEAADERRLHDFAADFRRFSRVFLRPASPQRDTAVFVNSLFKLNDRVGALQGVALTTQNLLIDSAGNIVPSPITYEAQFRIFTSAAGARKTEVRQLELSRALLLGNSAPGGFTAHDEQARHYLPSAGNDYGFASRQYNQKGPTEPLVVTLRTRCNACHGERAGHIFTFTRHTQEEERARLLNPARNDRASVVARQKTESQEFRALLKLWARY